MATSKMAMASLAAHIRPFTCLAASQPSRLAPHLPDLEIRRLRIRWCGIVLYPRFFLPSSSWFPANFVDYWSMKAAVFFLSLSKRLDVFLKMLRLLQRLKSKKTILCIEPFSNKDNGRRGENETR